MGFFITKEAEEEEKLKKEEATGVKINKYMIKKHFGEPKFLAEGIEATLWVYDDFLLLDRNKSKLFNAFNHTVKFIPFRSLVTLQFKNEGASVANIEFGVYGYDAAIKKNTDTDNENLFAFNASSDRSNATDIYFYILDKMRESKEFK